MPQKDSMFKSKHKLDLSLVSMDQRGKQLLGYSDAEMSNKGVYDLVHFDDLKYVESAHQELIKTGASGLIAYRLISKDSRWQWIQTSARLVYKNSKADFILCTHRPLMEEEGRDLLGKRTMDFKVTYLDGDLGAINDRSGLLSDSDFVLRCQRNRRYKSQIRDLITTCRSTTATAPTHIGNSKRKSLTGNDETTAVYTPPFTELSSTNAMSAAAAQAANAAAAAAAVAHVAVTANAAAVASTYPHHHTHPHHHHSHHPGPGSVSSSVYPYSAHAHTTDNMNLSAAAYGMPQNLFTAAAIDHNSRSFLASDPFLHYSRHALTTYYPDYHSVAQYPTNSFLDHRSSSTGRSTSFDSSASTTPTMTTDKLYGCQLTPPSEIKYNGSESSSNNNRSSIGIKSCCDNYNNSGSSSSSSLMGHHHPHHHLHPGASALVTVSAASIQSLLPTSPNENRLSELTSCHRNSSAFSFGLSNSSINGDCISVIKHKNSLPLNNNSPPSSSMETGSAPSTPSIPGSAFSSTSPLATSNSNGNNNQTTMSNDQSRSNLLMWNRNTCGATPLTISSSPSSSSSPTININNNGNKFSSSSSSSSSSLNETLTINKTSPAVSCKWNGSISNVRPLSPHHPSMPISPSSGKVPMSMTTYGSASLYSSTDINPIEGWSVENIGHWRSHLPTLG